MTNSLTGMPFRDTKDESIIAYFSEGKLLHYKRDELIINGLYEPQGVYLIKEGYIKAYSVSRSGQMKILIIHEADELIPLPWALNGTYKTGLSYAAMNEVTILLASKDKLRTTMGNNSWLSQEVLKQAVNAIAIYTQRIQTLEFRSARERVIVEILHLAERFGEKYKKEVLINIPITHQYLADSINMSRETASRVLELLFKEGLMSQNEHLFTILDLRKLQLALS